MEHLGIVDPGQAFKPLDVSKVCGDYAQFCDDIAEELENLENE